MKRAIKHCALVIAIASGILTIVTVAIQNTPNDPWGQIVATWPLLVVNAIASVLYIALGGLRDVWPD